ncbi:MAG TPA: FAD-dependent oxidoreductase, partial [Turneriella sp.]|nr:FAD-dependent oxidoreductase [Turneriella sp.]
MIAFDVVVIGSGPAGEGAAMQCAKDGKRVAMVDLNPELGGECLHRGTIPSKALRHSIQRFLESTTNPLVKVFQSSVAELNFPALVNAARSISRREAEINRRNYDRNRVAIFVGYAKITSPNTITVALRDGGEEMLSAVAIIIATGSRPYRPQDIPF